MTQPFDSAFAALQARYADTRFNLLDVHLKAQSGRLLATGRVLDDATRAVLHTALAGFGLDASAVQTLRLPGPVIQYVATNLTDLLGGPGWLNERLSQLTAGQPLEILETHERWGFVRQSDGYLGWAYLPYLTSTTPLPSSHILTAPVGLLRDEPSASAKLIGRALGGTRLRLVENNAGWARVAVFDDSPDPNPAQLPSGWLDTHALRPLDAFPTTPAAIRAQMVRDAASLYGVPYLWGGSSANGIDCSGFAQLLHAWVGITLPRDADLQFTAGRPVEPPYRPGDLLFYGDGSDAQRKITHVSLSVGGWDIIHSSRRRNGVAYDNVQAVDGLRETFAGARSFLPED